MPNRVPLLLFFSSYVKLQQAYFAESLKAGGWTLIGYTAPGNNGATTNFVYGIGGIAENTVADVSSAKVGWTADNLANLNECTKGSQTAGKNTSTTANWKVSVTQGAGNANQELVFDATVSGAGCTALTPTFDKIGK
ncbi:hypothetical protein [Fibrobacter intestinalis]|uniref:hypothetical protein n=1 Tax=Fibrobacter intestinalis TaxID=28122 RepID=UPI0023F34FF3|nr:hypothetical protein [Fibrobacter intestinalis]MDD7300244.1 hypothetical protein [Fibrobacter intestinalis]